MADAWSAPDWWSRRRSSDRDIAKLPPMSPDRPGSAALPCAALAVVLVIAAALIGCETPFNEHRHWPAVQQSVAQAIERELEGLPESRQPLLSTQPPNEVAATLEKVRPQLDKMGPQVRGPAPKGDLGPDLDNAEQQSVTLALDDAIQTAVRNNLTAQVASLQPAISAEDVIMAEAVFDAVLFTDLAFQKVDEPAVVPVLNGIPLGSPVTQSKSYLFDTGLRKQFTSGATAELSTGLQRDKDQTPGFTFDPNPAYTSDVSLTVSQPLLRGFGFDVNTATVRLSSNAQRRSVDALQGTLLDVVLETELAYWDLVLAWQTLAIRQWLTDVGVEVRNTLGRRREFDARLAEYAEAVAKVEERRSQIIVAQREVRAASDRLKELMNDPAISVASEAVLLPADVAAQSPLTYNLADAVRTGLGNRPEIRSALTQIDDAGIRQLLADNARLPALNLTGQITYTGLDDSGGGAYSNLGDDFIDYAVGLAFEYPLGNRAADAAFRQSRLLRSSSVISYRQAVQQVILDVKSALRNVLTTYQLLEATRSSRIAAAESLRTLLVTEQNLAALTPEFLQLKFDRQESLALTQFQESQAIANYCKSMAQLYNAMGIGLQTKGIAMEQELPPEEDYR